MIGQVRDAKSSSINHVLGTTIGTDWTGSLIAVCTAAVIGAALYTLAARVLGITEFRALTTALRINP
ncbi:hypothetical protein [Streptosporangium sp. NPDC000396]|uniref:hypothetical protein n=1 Tax=Streptosporangium sp. NPDC000396 TaxID=3366185 RepID=UPI00368E2FD2